jgi:hypothetical protein
MKRQQTRRDLSEEIFDDIEAHEKHLHENP